MADPIRLHALIANLSERAMVEAIAPTLIALDEDRVALAAADKKVRALFQPLEGCVYTDSTLESLAARGSLNDSEFALAKLWQWKRRHPFSVHGFASLGVPQFLAELAALSENLVTARTDNVAEFVPAVSMGLPDALPPVVRFDTESGPETVRLIFREGGPRAFVRGKSGFEYEGHALRDCPTGFLAACLQATKEWSPAPRNPFVEILRRDWGDTASVEPPESPLVAELVGALELELVEREERYKIRGEAALAAFEEFIKHTPVGDVGRERINRFAAACAQPFPDGFEATGLSQIFSSLRGALESLYSDKNCLGDASKVVDPLLAALPTEGTLTARGISALGLKDSERAYLFMRLLALGQADSGEAIAVALRDSKSLDDVLKAIETQATLPQWLFGDGLLTTTTTPVNHAMVVGRAAGHAERASGYDWRKSGMPTGGRPVLGPAANLPALNIYFSDAAGNSLRARLGPKGFGDEGRALATLPTQFLQFLEPLAHQASLPGLVARCFQDVKSEDQALFGFAKSLADQARQILEERAAQAEAYEPLFAELKAMVEQARQLQVPQALVALHSSL